MLWALPLFARVCVIVVLCDTALLTDLPGLEGLAGAKRLHKHKHNYLVYQLRNQQVNT